MKLKKLRIKNVQSVKDVTLNFEDKGVFHLVGANNIGKSVIVKAIKALFMNVSDNQYKEYLRDGCTTFSVEGEMWDGNRIKLSRGGTDYYEWEIDGESGRMDKTRGKLPPVVEKYVNMYVDKEKTKECLNIRMPRSILTFVDTTAGDNNYLVQKALGTDEFLASTKLAEKKRKESAKEIKLITGYKEREEVKLNGLEGIVATEKAKVERVEGFEEILRQEYDTYLKIEGVVQSAVKVQKLADELKEAKELVMDVDTKDILEEMEKVKKIESIMQTMKRMKGLKDDLSEAKEKLVGFDKEGLLQAIKEFKLVSDTLEEAKQLAKLKKQKDKALEEYEKSDKELTDFMRENKFCPIVAKTINKQCPFTEVEGVFS